MCGAVNFGAEWGGGCRVDTTTFLPATHTAKHNRSALACQRLLPSGQRAPAERVGAPVGVYKAVEVFGTPTGGGAC